MTDTRRHRDTWKGTHIDMCSRMAVCGKMVGVKPNMPWTRIQIWENPSCSQLFP